jgi:hypothetical protein
MDCSRSGGVCTQWCVACVARRADERDGYGRKRASVADVDCAVLNRRQFHYRLYGSIFVKQRQQLDNFLALCVICNKC